jgi:hypothetical protein
MALYAIMTSVEANVTNMANQPNFPLNHILITECSYLKYQFEKVDHIYNLTDKMIISYQNKEDLLHLVLA